MSDSPPRRRPYDTFRPRLGARVARVCAVAAVVVFGLTALLAPRLTGTGDVVDVVNRVLTALLGLAVGGFLWRYALIRAEPSPAGLKVVNLVQTYELEWAQILRVGYSGGSPWAVLELTDTEEVAVMAIQRADGPSAQREASRLAALIEHHQRPAGPPAG